MADMGDLTKLLEENTLADLDWLDLSEEELERLRDNVPEQNLDVVPDLMAAWSDRDADPDEFRLSEENVDPRESGETPFWSERVDPVDEGEQVEELVDHLRRTMQASGDPMDALKDLKSNFDRDLIRSSMDEIREVMDERGLLGNVYIDSEIFEDCQNGEGRESVRANNESAEFVLSKPECDDCVHATNGRCAVFDKELVDEVPWNESLWNYYESYVSSRGYDTTKISADGDWKERIQRAFLEAPEFESEGIDSKPKEEYPDVSAEEAAKAIKAASGETEVVDDPKRIERVKKVARQMCLGNHGEEVREAIANDEDLSVLEPHLDLLGRLYVAEELLDDELEQEMLARRPDLEGTPVVHITDPDHLKQPEVLAGIADRWARHEGEHERIAAVREQLVPRLADEDASEIRRVAKRLFAKPLPSERRTYRHAPSSEEDRPEIDSDEAKEVLRQADDPSAEGRPEWLDWVSDSSHELLHTMQDRWGKGIVRKLEAHHSKWASVDPIEAKEGHAHLSEAVDDLMSDDYEARGVGAPGESHFQNEVGKFLRDRMIAGDTGSRLVDAVDDRFDKETLIDHLPVLTAMREEEGLYGRVYTTADSFDKCREGSASVPSHVPQIVRGERCEGCLYNRMGNCMMYGKELVDEPVYDQEVLTHSLARAVSSGRLSKKTAEKLAGAGAGTEDKIRVANTTDRSGVPRRESNELGRRSGANLTAFRGSDNTQKGKHRAKRAIVKAAQKKHKEGWRGEDLVRIMVSAFGNEKVTEHLEDVKATLDEVDPQWHDERTATKTLDSGDMIQDSTGASSANDQLDEFDMQPNRSSSPLDGIELNPQGEQEQIDVEFGGMSF